MLSHFYAHILSQEVKMQKVFNKFLSFYYCIRVIEILKLLALRIAHH